MDVWTGVGLVFLVVGFPLALLALLGLLGRLEAWMLRPEERAAAVVQVLEQAEGADEVEVAVSRLLAEVADPPRPSPLDAGPTRPPGQRRARRRLRRWRRWRPAAWLRPAAARSRRVR